jgi:hypothetical protein
VLGDVMRLSDGLNGTVRRSESFPFVSMMERLVWVYIIRDGYTHGRELVEETGMAFKTKP